MNNNANQKSHPSGGDLEGAHILVIGRHPEILATVVRLVNNNPDWQATGCLTDHEAIQHFNTQPCTLILLGGGIPAESEQHLSTYFRSRNPQIKIVQHYGGGSGLLAAEIYEALK
jgi:DNA-binding NarL/FixJ family response regulator